MRSSPPLIQVLTAPPSLQVDLLVVLCSLVSVCQQLIWRSLLRTILISWTCNFLARALDAAILPQTHVWLLGCKSNHGQLCDVALSANSTWLHHLRLGMDSEVSSWAVAVDDIAMMPQCQGRVRTCFSGCCISGLRSSWPFLSSKVLLGEALLTCLGFPVVVSNPSAVDDDSAAKLSKHRFGSHNCNLPRTI